MSRSMKILDALTVLFVLMAVFSVGMVVYTVSQDTRAPTVYVDPDTGCEYLAVGFGAVVRYDVDGRNIRGCREGAGRE